MRKLLTSLIAFVFIFFAFSVSKVSAKVVSEQTNYVVGSDEVINDDLFVGAQTVEIDGIVNGDVFVGAQSVKITGTINGNLHVGTNILDLEGAVKGNVYVGAQSVVLNNAKIGGSLLTGTSSLTTDKDSTIGGSLMVGSATASINSKVGRSVYIGSGALTIGSNAVIGKDLYYAVGKDESSINISENAKITGSTYKSEPKTPQTNVSNDLKKLPGVFSAFRVFFGMISFFGALIVGFIYLKLLGKKHFEEVSDLVSNSFWKSLGIGFLATLAVIPGIIILLLTVVGIPVAGLVFLLSLIFFYLSKIVVASSLGRFLSQKMNWKASTYMVFALGLLAIYILRMIPYVNFLAGLVVLWAGFGALSLRLFSK